MFEIAYFTERTGSMKIQYCDVKRDLQNAYFIITISYIIILMFIPIILIFICNTFIIMRILHVNKQRQKMFLESYSIQMSSVKNDAEAEPSKHGQNSKVKDRSYSKRTSGVILLFYCLSE
jgi:hypothetical protein